MALNVTSQIEEIQLMDASDETDDRKGYVDVRYWLNDEEQLVATAEVRVYFTRTDISLDELTSAAPIRAQQVMSQIAQHFESGKSHTPEQLWRQSKEETNTAIE
jgi:hypothetical protein